MEAIERKYFYKRMLRMYYRDIIKNNGPYGFCWRTMRLSTNYVNVFNELKELQTYKPDFITNSIEGFWFDSWDYAVRINILKEIIKSMKDVK